MLLFHEPKYRELWKELHLLKKEVEQSTDLEDV